MTTLVGYSDSDSEESDNGVEETQQGLQNNKRKSNKLEEGLLPLPDAIKSLQTGIEAKRKKTDDPAMHDGRIRSFEHVEGNWATHVFIPYDPDERMSHMVDEMLRCLRPLEFHRMEEFHISLSRTVVIRHHWIQPLTDSLQKKLTNSSRTFCELTEVKTYTNDEETRSFLALEVVSHNAMLRQYVKSVDECFQEYRLQKYYEKPSFHISIAWSLGNVLPKISEGQLSQLQEILDRTVEEEPDLKVIIVDKIQCRTGNKAFNFPLQA